MFDINPHSQRHYFADLERQMQPKMRDYRKPGSRGLAGGLNPGVYAAVLAISAFLLGSVAGRSLF